MLTRLMSLLLLSACILSINAQDAAELHKALEQAEKPVERIIALEELVHYHRMRNTDSTFHYADQLIELGNANGDYDAVSLALIGKGQRYHSNGQFDQAALFYYECLALIRQHDLTTQKGHLLGNLAWSHYRQARLDSAYFYFAATEEAYEETGETYQLWRVYWGLASVYERNGDIEQAIHMMEKALPIVENGGIKADHGFFLYNMFAFYFRHGDYDQMADVRSKWDAYQQQYKSSREIIDRPEHSGLSALLGLPNDTLEVYLLEGLAHYDSTGNLFMEAWNYEELGDLALEKADQTAAKAYYIEANRRYLNTNLTYRRARTLRQLYLICQQMRQYPESMGYLVQYKELSDSIFNAEATRNLQQLQVQYETEKKEQALRINQLELNQKTQQRNILLGSSVLLGILAIAIFFGLRLRLRTNEKLATQGQQLQEQRILQLQQEQKLLAFNAMIEGQEQERLRIAKDLHDGLGGLLTTIKAHVGSLALPPSDLFGKTVDLIDHACVEVRRISHNMMPGALALSGLSGALDDLVGQLRRSGYNCHLEVLGNVDELPQTRMVMVYRIVQELTNNIRKHAEAKQILIQLLRHQSEFTLIVEDDGQGFDLEAARQKNSVGLQSIDSRVRYLQGAWDVDSVTSEGTTVTVRFPAG